MFKLPQYVLNALQTIENNGYKAYIVGGSVRDLLLNKTPNDYDIATNASPETVLRLFENTVATGLKHGTVTVVTNNGNIEVTTFRTDGVYVNHRSPENVDYLNNITEDLSRRDFTVNAMAYNNSEGLIDVFNGKSDLDNRVIRAVGDANCRFNEDALRILRAFRFSAVLDFKIEASTLNAAVNCAEILQFVSRERIAAEILKAVMGKNIEALKPLILCGAFEFINIHGCEELNSISKLPKNINLRFFGFAMCCNIIPADLCSELKLSKQIQKYCANMYAALNNLPKNKAEIKIAMNNYGVEIIKDLFVYLNDDEKAKTVHEILTNNEPYKISQLNITGDDIMELNISGENVGTVLKKLLDYVIYNPEKNSKEFLTDYIKEKLM